MTYTISGVVIDSNGNPIENASIYKSDPFGKNISRTYERTLSDKNGRFELKNFSENDSFSVSKSGNILKGTAFKTYTNRIKSNRGTTPIVQSYTITLPRVSRADLLNNIQKAEMGVVNKGIVSQIETTQKRAEQRVGLMNNIQRTEMGALNKDAIKESDKLSEGASLDDLTDSSSARISQENKIFGMPKMIAVGVGILILGISAFVIYKKVNK
jgi:hypothetical protein